MAMTMSTFMTGTALAGKVVGNSTVSVILLILRDDRIDCIYAVILITHLLDRTEPYLKTQVKSQ